MDARVTSPIKESHGYKALRESAGYCVLDAGLLELQGDEATDFLHRLSTNDLHGLTPGKVRPTILTNEKGRMIDFAKVLRDRTNLFLIVSGKNSANVKAWLERYIIMEDVKVRDPSGFSKRISLIGPDAFSIVSSLTGAAVGQDDESFYGVEGIPGLFVYKDPIWPLPAYEIIGDAGAIDVLCTRLPESVQSVARDALEALRVESGVQEFSREITSDSNPLEAGLGRFVSFTKGCYIGQEVIARLDTYKKVQKSLTGFVFPPGLEMPFPGHLRFDGADAGWTTSHAYSPSLERYVALGYMKLHAGLSRADFTQGSLDVGVPVEVVKLPIVPHTGRPE